LFHNPIKYLQSKPESLDNPATPKKKVIRKTVLMNRNMASSGSLPPRAPKP